MMAVGQRNGPPPGEVVIFRRILNRFGADITCRHGSLLAPHCTDGCKRENWLDALVRTEPGEPPKTVGDVVRDYLAAGMIPSIEVIERYVDREGKKDRQRRRTYTTYAAIAGLAIVGGLLVLEGGKIVLRLWKKAEGQNR